MKNKLYVCVMLLVMISVWVMPRIVVGQEAKRVIPGDIPGMLDVVPENYKALFLMRDLKKSMSLRQKLYPDRSLETEQKVFDGKTGLDPEAPHLIMIMSPQDPDHGLVMYSVFVIKDTELFNKEHQLKVSEEGFIECIDQTGEQSFARILGDKVIFHNNKMALMNMKPAEMGTDIAKLFHTSPLKMQSFDAMGMVNMKQMRHYMNETMDVEKNMERFKGPVKASMFEIYFGVMSQNWMKRLAADTTEVLMGFKSVKGDIHAEAAAAFTKDSTLGKSVMRDTVSVPFKRLPDLPFFYAFKADFERGIGADLLTELLKDMVAGTKNVELGDLGTQDGLPFMRLIIALSEGFLRMGGDLESLEMIVPAPERIDIRNVFSMITVKTLEKPDHFIEQYDSLVKALNQESTELEQGDDLSLDFQKNLMTINGKQVSVLKMNPKSMPMVSVIGLHQRHLVPGKDAVMEMLGGDFSLLSKGMKAMEGDEGLQKNPLVEAAQQRALKNSYLFYMVDMQQLARAFGTFSASMQGKKLPDAKGLKPYVLSMSHEQGWLRARMEVPISSFLRMEEFAEGPRSQQEQSQEADVH